MRPSLAAGGGLWLVLAGIVQAGIVPDQCAERFEPGLPKQLTLKPTEQTSYSSRLTTLTRLFGGIWSDEVLVRYLG